MCTPSFRLSHHSFWWKEQVQSTHQNFVKPEWVALELTYFPDEQSLNAITPNNQSLFSTVPNDQSPFIIVCPTRALFVLYFKLSSWRYLHTVNSCHGAMTKGFFFLFYSVFRKSSLWFTNDHNDQINMEIRPWHHVEDSSHISRCFCCFPLLATLSTKYSLVQWWGKMR